MTKMRSLAYIEKVSNRLLSNEHSHPVLVEYFDNFKTFCDSCQTLNSASGGPKTQTIIKD